MRLRWSIYFNSLGSLLSAIINDFLIADGIHDASHTSGDISLKTPKKKKEYCGKTTIRILKEKEWVKEEFSKLVMDELHSDICYVTVSLWEAFILAFRQVPNTDDSFVMTFPRQNIQINMGCNFNYNVRKARRKPYGIQDPLSQPRVELRKNLFLPLVLDEWKTLSEKQKQQIIVRLVEEGIVPSEFLEYLETQKHKNSEPMEQCLAFDGKKKLLCFLRWMVTPLW